MPAAGKVTPMAGPSTADILADWTFRPVPAALLIAAAAAYLTGVVRVARRHPARPWPWARTASFLGGLAVIAVALMSAVGHYDRMFFWVHMVQHLMLIMAAPVLLIVGRPLILALHATRNPAHRRIKAFLRSRFVTAVTWPPFAIAAYVAVVIGTHLTGFNDLAVRSAGWTATEQIAYLVSGYLYLLSGFGDEPIRWRLSRPAKMVLILLTMPIDTFTGITLLMTNEPMWPAYAAQNHAFGPDPVTDIQWGGATMWIGGDTIMILLIVSAIFAWISGPGRGRANRMRWIEQARLATFDRYGAALPHQSSSGHTDLDDDQARLDAYNAWLAEMAARDRRQRR